jgi:hypothetical protein
MTHEYTLLVNGTVLPGDGAEPCEALAWAHETILAVGSTSAIDAISRGDSTRIDLHGAFVVSPGGRILEPGEPANLDVLEGDPRLPGGSRTLATVRGGRVTQGSLRALRGS